MPVGRRLSVTERLRLIAEILRSYRDARKALRHTPIAPAVNALRSNPPAASQRPAGSHPDREQQLLHEAWRLGRAVRLTLRLLPGDTRCLTRSLVLTQMLAQRGIPATLVIGARTEPRFLAHAWVEYAGEPVLPSGDGSFGRLVEL